jgi:hypothetical protein
MKTSSSFPGFLEDQEADEILREAEEELKQLSQAQRRELFGTDWLPPSPEDFPSVDWDDQEVPEFFL